MTTNYKTTILINRLTRLLTADALSADELLELGAAGG